MQNKYFNQNHGSMGNRGCLPVSYMALPIGRLKKKKDTKEGKRQMENQLIIDK